jgi:hypothetical protein
MYRRINVTLPDSTVRLLEGVAGNFPAWVSAGDVPDCLERHYSNYG